MQINDILFNAINERNFEKMQGQFNDKLNDFFEKSNDPEPSFKVRRFYSNLNSELIKKNLNIDSVTLGKILNSDKMMKLLSKDFPKPNTDYNKSEIIKKLDKLIDKIIKILL